MLKEYFKKHLKVKKIDFATRIGLPAYITLYKYINGDDIPSKEYMKAIKAETKGKVIAHDLL